MPDDDKSMDVQLIWNQRVVNYNKLRGMNPMGLSSSWDDSFVIIASHPIKNTKDETNGP